MHWKQNIFVRTIALNRVWMRLDVRTKQKHRQPKSVYCMNTSFSKTETFKHTNELNTFQSYSNDLNLRCVCIDHTSYWCVNASLFCRWWNTKQNKKTAYSNVLRALIFKWPPNHRVLCIGLKSIQPTIAAVSSLSLVQIAWVMYKLHAFVTFSRQ